MNTMIIACRTLKPELEKAMEETACDFRIEWIESGLHNVPRKLNNALWEKMCLAEKRNIDRVLLAMGFCGNTLAGLKTGAYETVIPRTDDCISLLLGSVGRRKEIQAEAGTYFMTKGWAEGERNILTEYEYTVQKYGEEKGRRIMKRMFAHYERIGLLDTHCGNVSEVTKLSKKVADTLSMNMLVIESSNQYLKDLLTGPYDEKRFLTVPENTVIDLNCLDLFE